MNIWQRQDMIFSKEENKKIHNTVALIAGTGGLGTHQAQELQRLGVKKLYLVDNDIIEESNLNRQIFYGYNDIGQKKLKIAQKMMNSFNLNTEIIVLNQKIDKDFLIPPDVDLVFDGLDNFKTRYVLEDLINEQNIPLIHGGIHSWYGQITIIIPGRTMKLSDIFGTESDSPEKIPAISPAVAIVASFQVIEGIKYILNRDDILLNKLLIIDLNDYTIDIVDLNN